jgi:hypothetical protein
MKKVIFETLKIINFLSIGKTPVVINFQKGLNIITGINKDLMDRQNGVGKTTVIDALYYSLFGETTRELKKEFITNNITNDTSEISLDFSIDDVKYKIVRSIKPSKCFLYENDNDISRDSILNTTEYVLSILELTPEIFNNCICLSVNSTTPFMAQKKIEKRKFIEGIFNLDIFSKMNAKLKEEYNEIKKDISMYSTKSSDLEKTIKFLYESQNRRKEERKNKEQAILANIDKCNSEIEKIKERLSNYEIADVVANELKVKKLEEMKKENEEKLRTFSNNSVQFHTEIKNLKDKLSKIGTDDDECPVCLRSIEAHDLNHIEKRKEDILLEIKEFLKRKEESDQLFKKIQENISFQDKGISVLNPAINKNNILIQQKKNDEEKIILFENQILKDRDFLSSLNNGDEEEIENNKKTEKKLSIVTEKLNEARKQSNIFNDVKFVLSEEGVKSYVVKKILNIFNSKILYYLKELQSNCTITFDQYFEEEIKNDRDKPTMYFNYSGAERKAIDLAVMFSFIDMLKLQTNVHYNVQFYDELLDSSLDSAGVENVVRLLNDFVENNSIGIYVISHRKECSKLANGEIVFLEKENGITKRIDFQNA